MTSDSINRLTIRKLAQADRYLIPIYQRNYDWGERETLQLIEDFADFAASKPGQNYYIGSLVVFSRRHNGHEYFEAIDGQQRLTTLTILLSLLKNRPDCADAMQWYKGSQITYDHRPEADDALTMLIESRLSNHPAACSITDVYRILDKHLDDVLKAKNLTISDFLQYLLDKVVIMRIAVPQDTDLNHYFEIMNSRGEQLEKHEVLKAQIIDRLEATNPAETDLFNLIWEACSDMSVYAIMKFPPELRYTLFGDNWDTLIRTDFQSMVDAFTSTDNISNTTVDCDDNSQPLSLSQLRNSAISSSIKYPDPDAANNNDDDSRPDRFGSVINFPNFLLQVLKVMFRNDPDYDKEIHDAIKLDDKRLIDIFYTVFQHVTDKPAFARRYIYALLHLRVIFDRFIIKRETYNGKENWCLKRLKRYDSSKTNYVGTFSDSDDEDDLSKDIRMLQAMFHVSAPTQIYKHWLNATLFHLYKGDTSAKTLREYLYRLARTYMLDRYLSNKHIDFEDIIYKNQADPVNTIDDIDWTLLNQGCKVENFIFNFYDYIIWHENPAKYPRFEFSYRTSVEHFYPRTPMPQYPTLTTAEGIDDFGNLCLISRSMNSKFSNNMPRAKCANFGPEARTDQLSIKLIDMMNTCENTDWSIPQIAAATHTAHTNLLAALSK